MTASRQEQRHWPAATIAAAAAAAGMGVAGPEGQRTGVRLDAELDEATHTKALCFATCEERGGGDGMDIYRP
jgi:hypothetical protein